MLIKIGDHSGLVLGRSIFRYLLPDRSAYDKGPVVEITDLHVVVDFGDTIRRFNKQQVSLVMDAYTADEYFMTIVEGEMMQDFREHHLPVTDDSLDDFSDLLGKLHETTFEDGPGYSARSG
jgi:hypothetical protein